MKTKKPLVMKFSFDDGEPAFFPVAEVIADNLEQLARLAAATGNRKPLRGYCEKLAHLRYEQLAEEYPRELARQAKARKAEDLNERLRPWFDHAYRNARTFHQRIGAGLLLNRTIDVVEKWPKDEISDDEREELIGLLNEYRARIYLKNRQN